MVTQCDGDIAELPYPFTKSNAFISLSEHIDYSTPEGMLQLTILAAFAAYFSDMLAKHTSKG